jgi:hypothetical protein
MKAAIIAVIISLLIFFTIHLLSRTSRLKSEGDEIICKIEAFNKENGRLPDSLSEIGIEEKLEGPIYYDKKDDSEYIVWFGAGLGESVIYHSTTKEWDE